MNPSIEQATSVHDFTVEDIQGQSVELSQYRGKGLLIVNTASQCGLTPQYDGLQTLHSRFADKGLVVLGFPCNQFGSQEPGTEAEISQFCETRFGVTFPMFAKIDVNGPQAHPLYAWLRAQTGGADIEWNFAKFLIDEDGQVVKRYNPMVKPAEIGEALEQAYR